MFRTSIPLMFYLVYFAFHVPAVQANSNRVKVLLNICDVALQNADNGTIKNIATQLNTLERPDDPLLKKQYDNCLTTAFGTRPEIENLDDILNQINQASEALEKNCKKLLKASPETAVTHTFCKEILIK